MLVDTQKLVNSWVKFFVFFAIFLRYFMHLMIVKDLNICFSIKNLISTSKQRAEHPLAG